MIGFSLAEAIIGVFSKCLDKFIPDKDKQAELLEAVREKLLENEQEIVTKASENVLAEIHGESWLQRNWRPILMMVGVFVIFNNFVLAPYIHAFTGFDLMLNVDTSSIPRELWNLLDIGMGGYIMGRSAEKISRHIAPAIAKSKGGKKDE